MLLIVPGPVCVYKLILLAYDIFTLPSILSYQRELKLDVILMYIMPCSSLLIENGECSKNQQLMSAREDF